MQGFALFCAVVIVKTDSACDQPIDLNQATLPQLDSLPYITPSTAQLIMDIRPICFPIELTYSPKKIIGITEDRLNDKWNWFLNKTCSETCCKAHAFCDGRSVPSTPAIYSWETGAWSECTAECGNGKQYRDLTCVDSNNTIVDSKYCLAIHYKPINKQICNTEPCPIYKWMPSKWQRCMVDPNGICIKKREVFCYDTVNDITAAATKCDTYCDDKPDIIKACNSCAAAARLIESIDIRSERPGSKRSLLDWDSTVIGGAQVYFDLIASGNTCNTDMYRNVPDKTLIIRRGCYAYILIYVVGLPNNPTVDLQWFYLDATLQADSLQIDNGIWYNNYLSWIPYGDDYPTAGWLAVNIASDGYIGEFVSNLYYQENGNSANRELVTDFTVYVLFNPYNINDEVYMSSAVDIEEYVENEFGLIWVGSSDVNSAMQWSYDQFHFPNLKIAMDSLHRLDLQYRNNLVLISRQISYAVGTDICYGRWSGSYTTGQPDGGYACTPFAQENICKQPGAWSGTTQLFDLYREVNYQRVQYCQCFVYAAVSTTVGRALGIPTRPTTNFQSAHDSDYNRAIEKYWILSSDGLYLTPASREDIADSDIESSDSVWNFHVWNEMYFERSDFINSAYNHRGWQIVDATPQEVSCGGNPNINCAYQLGPASLILIKDNRNPDECISSSLPSNYARFGCFDTEFVISETNANFNFWLKDEHAASGSKYKLQWIFETDPWDTDPWHDTIGALTNTKRPGAIDDDCLNEAIGDCDDEYLDLTLAYKWQEPSDPGIPTDNKNVHSIGDLSDRRRRMRRRLWSSKEYSLNDLDTEGIEYRVETMPHQYYVTPMIIADDTDDIIGLYGADYTFGMISIIMDSYHDNPLNVYCGFTLTAHNYNGEQIYLNDDNTTNGIVKSETDNFTLEAGYSGACQFNVNYNEYSKWISVNINTTPKGKRKRKKKRKRQRNFDGPDTPFAFKFTVSVSLFDGIDISEPYQIIIEERDILVCTPKLKLKDRIMCRHKMKWFEPSKFEYECNGSSIISEVGDGFCDEENNFDGCYDGGDCCKSTCIPSENHKCPRIFNCINDEIKYKKHNKNYKKCPKISSFIDYIDKIDELRESSVCSDTINNFVCSEDYGSQCVDSILSKKDIRLFGKIENCFDEMFDSLDLQMKQIVHKIIDCAIENGQLKEKRTKNREAKNKKKLSAFSVGFSNEFNGEIFDDTESNSKDWYDFGKLIGDNMILSIVIIFVLMMSIIICILYACKCNRKYQGMKKIGYDTDEFQSDIEQHPINH